MAGAGLGVQQLDDVSTSPRRRGDAALLGVAVAFVLIASRVVLRGAPLMDDYFVCHEVGSQGLVPYLLGDHFAFRGLVRTVHWLEIAWIGSACGSIPWQLIILPGLLLTLWVGWILRGLLIDLEVADPWPSLAAALWLLQPLGFEAALWPSAIHLPLGLGLLLVALRRYRRGDVVLGTALMAAAYLSNEIMFVAPVLVWLVTPPAIRRRATVAAGILAVVVLGLYQAFPGSSWRTDVAVLDRVTAIPGDPSFYLRFPVIGLGVQSIPFAVMWAFPISLLVLAFGAWAGARGLPALLRRADGEGPPAASWGRTFLLVVLLLLVLTNVPNITYTPKDDSPRLFTPTWLLLSGTAAVAAHWLRWRPGRVAGAIAGCLAAGALLSLALSASVRVRSADLSEHALRDLASSTPPGTELVAVCDAPLKPFRWSPAGAFALHDIQEFVAPMALRYWTGAELEVSVAVDGCPDVPAETRRIPFDRWYP